MSKHVLITGANRGIGLEFCKQYASAGFTVTAVVRQSSAELDSIDNIRVITGIDVSCDEGVARLVSQQADTSIDILINNAGVFSNETLANMDFTAIERQLQINAVAPIKVTYALQAHLKTGAKVAMITSRMGSISDNSSGAYIGYRMS